MAIPEYYYAPDGTKISREKLVNDMITHYREETDSEITDFSEGTEIRNILESVALSFFGSEYYTNYEFRQHFLTYAEGSFLDLHGKDRGIIRREGTRASGFVTVTIPEALNYDFVIDNDTTFMNPETSVNYEIYFNVEQINEDYHYIIPTGETSILLPVVCQETGKIGNSARGTVTGFFEQPTLDDVTVTNEEPITDGLDDETDEEYRIRLLTNEKNNSISSKPYYETLLREVTGVHDAYVTFGDEHVKCYINGNNKPVSDAVLVECAELLNRDTNHALGHTFNFYKPDYNTIHLRIEINTHDNLTSQDIINRVLHLIDGGTDNEMTYYGLNMGDTLTEYDIISAITSLEGVDTIVPYIANTNGEYERFSKIVCQQNEVVYAENVEVIFRE